MPAGRTSWAGSYGALAQVKAAFLNEFMRTREIGSVIEFGCGDGNQLSLAYYPVYIGPDVSCTAIKWCQYRFAADSAKSFFLHDSACFSDRAEVFIVDLAISLDVIYHLNGDAVLRDLPDAPIRRCSEVCDHLRHQPGDARNPAARPASPCHSPWVETHCPLPGLAPAGGDAGPGFRLWSRGLLHLRPFHHAVRPSVRSPRCRREPGDVPRAHRWPS